MTITVFRNFSKKRNSTKRPSGGYSRQAFIKAPTSIENPVFILDETDTELNYFQAFGHYYFVDDVVILDTSRAEYHCSEDHLATWKSAITSSKQYILRCADSRYYDGKIIDTLYPKSMKPMVRVTRNTGTPFRSEPGTGAQIGKDVTLILTLKGANGSGFWAMRLGNFEELGTALFTVDQDTVWDAIGLTTLTKTYLDPGQYITNAIIIPIDDIDLRGGTSTDTITLGYWSYSDPDGTQIFTKLSNQICYKTTSSLTLSLATPRTGAQQFLNSNQYRRVKLTLPGAGDVELDADIAYQGSNIKVDFSVDVTGAIQYIIKYGSNYDAIRFVGGQIGVPFAIHAQTANPTQALGAQISGYRGNAIVGAGAALAGIKAGSAVGSIAGPIGTGVGGIIGGAIGSALGAVGSAGPIYNTQSVSNDGSIAGINANRDIIMEETIYNIPDQDIDLHGAPCCKYMTVGNLEGYIQTSNASIEIDGFEGEKTTIESMLDSGIFIE